MEFKKNIEFDKTVEAFKKMALKDKHNVVINELKETLAFLEMIMKAKDIKCEVLYNKEILDTRSNLIMNAMICYCKDNNLPLTIENKLNPIITNGILPPIENESIKLEDVIEKYQNRLNLVRRTR